MQRLLLALPLAIALVLPAGADAQSTKTITVPSVVVVEHGQRPNVPNNCSSVAFARWNRVTNAVSATARFAVATTGAPRPTTVSAEGPLFDNTLTYVATYTAPPGSDQIAIGRNAQLGGTPNTCEENAKRLDAAIIRPVTVEVVVTVDQAACQSAQKALANREKAVARLQGKVNRAKGRRKARLLRALRVAKKARDAAQAKVAEVC